MDIQGLHYQNPSTWKRVIKPLQTACAQALQTVAGDCLALCHPQMLALESRKSELEKDELGKEEYKRLLKQLRSRHQALLTEPLMVQHGGILHQTLLQLAPRSKTLARRFVDTRREVSVYDLIVDLVIALGRHYEPLAAADTAAPKYIRFMARRLAAVSDPDSVAQLSKVAFEVFSDLRHELDLEAMRVQHGFGESVNWLDRKLRLVDTVQNECLRFLESWMMHPDLAALVLGHELQVRVPSVALRRALNQRRLPAPWLMRWDQHYVHIKAELARRSGVPLSDAQMTKLKPPMSSLRRDTFICEKDAVGELLAVLATMRAQGLVNTADVDLVDAMTRVRVVPDDDEVELLPAPAEPGLLDPIDEPDAEGDEPSATDQCAEGQLGADDDDGDEVEITDEDDLETDDSAPGKVGVDVDELSAPEEKLPPMRGARLSGVRPARAAPDQSVIDEWLGHLPVTVRVGLQLMLARTLSVEGGRQKHLSNLLEQFIQEGVFEYLKVQASPQIKLLTDALLAANTPNSRAERGVSLPEYAAALDRAKTEYLDCARKHFEQMRRGND